MRILTHTGLAVSLPIGSNETQAVEVADAEDGTFTLTFAGQTTGAIDFDAVAGDVEAALEALSNLAPGDVACTEGPLGTAPVTATFAGVRERENVPLMTADGALLVGEDAAVTVTTVAEGAGDDTLVYSLLGKRKRLDEVGDDERILTSHGRAVAKSSLTA